MNEIIPASWYGQLVTVYLPNEVILRHGILDASCDSGFMLRFDDGTNQLYPWSSIVCIEKLQ